MALAALLIAELIAGGAVVGPGGSGIAPAGPSVTAAAPGGPRIMVPVSRGGSRTDDLLRRVGGQFDGAVATVERFWGTDWQRETARDVTVVATGSDAQFAAEAGLDPARTWSDIAAVAVADQVDPVRRVATGQRIVLAPGASTMSDSALRMVLTHELFHLAARADTTPDAPRWLTEGVADFVARERTGVPPSAAADSDLPGDADLDSDGPQRSAAYDRAWWFARFVADAHGEDGLRRLYLSACGPGHAGLEAAVREALGTDLQSLRTEWAQWLSRGGTPDNVSTDDANPSGHQ